MIDIPHLRERSRRRATVFALLVGLPLSGCQAPSPPLVAPPEPAPPDTRAPAPPLAKPAATRARPVEAAPEPAGARSVQIDQSAEVTPRVSSGPTDLAPLRAPQRPAVDANQRDPAAVDPAPVPQAKQRGRVPLPQQNSFYARDNPSYGLLQKANEALAAFPVDAEGQVDWVEALRRGMIQPRSGVAKNPKMEVLDQDILMTNTRDMPYVVFPHQVHTEWLTCQNCHEALFVAKRGANPITMNDIFRGKYCGQCHDRVAFSTYVCNRCHTVPKPRDKK